ncbi:D-alanyl-D-alanine carboxypeptidase family protein [Anaeropeptidivorans aminofermentans]|jgi:D-alanyl-D-alanine carboxypeptidase (penicillin-binding protein 5/6)|uniref:D-alanyl-D-alanine carboxypeptidase family protein n=1 Tax=Anaeropeptidivorans aminofermentans TaxID=2934315 RepID=UPI002024F06C|nr:D-alanyl-D-alanine carboxypeptidase family protein [Anaeropeptidivorans aminofermentans]MBE6011292.1 D-alanyl-D-alanine carboxypeptidase [Lachnospiraceae bacterium]
MHIRKISMILAFSFILSAASVAFAQETKTTGENVSGLSVKAKSAVLMEPSTGKIVYEFNPDEKLPPASVTKVMTLLLVYEALEQGKIGLDEIVTISEYAAGMGGSQVYLEPGEQQTVRDLIKCIAIPSANDAAVAMAEYVAGSEEAFVMSMNKRAEELGMQSTHFVNACGLDAEGHLTSAKDIAIMSKELINKYPEVLELTSIWMDSIVHKTARGESEFGLTNTNKLLKAYSGANGLKTGSTGKAGYCVSATAKRDDMMLIAVIMGSDSGPIRFNEARKLLDYGFANYTLSVGDPAGTDKGQIKVNKGELDSVKIVVKDQVNVLMDKGNHIELESQIDVLDSINAPVTAGTKVGEIIYLSDGKEAGRSDLVCADDVHKANIGHMVKKLSKRWFE